MILIYLIIISTEKSVLDAASNGALSAIQLIEGIVANLIAFISFVSFLNGIIAWLGLLIGYDYLSLEWFTGKLFIPVAFIMGIPWDECEKVGAIVATKTIINEFVAYQKLGELIEKDLITVSRKTIHIIIIDYPFT